MVEFQSLFNEGGFVTNIIIIAEQGSVPQFQSLFNEGGFVTEKANHEEQHTVYVVSIPF